MYGGRSHLQLREGMETFAPRSGLFTVAYVVVCCTTRSPSPQWTTGPARPTSLRKAAELFQTTWHAGDWFTHLPWKSLAGQWKTTRSNGLIRLTGNTPPITVPPPRSCDVFKEVASQAKHTPPTYLLLVCGRLFGRL